jgi:hypothetical protein
MYFTKINSSHPFWGIKDNTAIFIGDTETELASDTQIPSSCHESKAVHHYTPLQQFMRDSFPVFDALDEQVSSFNVYWYMVKLASHTIGKLSLNLDFGHFSSVDVPLHFIVTDIANLLSLSLYKKVTARG